MSDKKETDKRIDGLRSGRVKKIITISLLAAFIIASVLIFVFVGKPMLEFVTDVDRVRDYVEQNGFLSRLAFVGGVFLQTVVAIIPGEPFELAAGYVFGAWQGLLLCLIGILLGSLVIFILVRRLGMKAVLVFFTEEQFHKLKFLQESPQRNIVIFLLMFIPGTPKDILSYFAGLTDLKLWKWMVIVAVGRIPSVLTSTLGAGAIGSKNYVQAIVIFGITLVISAIGCFIYYRFVKKHSKEKN